MSVRGHTIEEYYDADLVDRGYSDQLVFFSIENGKTHIIYQRYNGKETWPDDDSEAEAGAKKVTEKGESMKVSVDVYTKNIDAALAAYKRAIEDGATDVCLNSSEDYETKEFEYVNLRFEIDHTAEVIGSLDDGPFSKDYDTI